MVRLDLDQVVMRRMKEDDIEMVKALIKEGSVGTENRLILHILTRPLCLFVLAVFSSILRCLVHSFILALAIPVFLLIVFLKITMPRSTGVLGSSRPYWDYVGSSYRGTQDETLQNPYCRISGKTPVTKNPRCRIGSKDKDKEMSTKKMTIEREQAAGQVWVADCKGEILGCIFRESGTRAGIRKICRLVTGCWYRREGLGRLLVQSLCFVVKRRVGPDSLTFDFGHLRNRNGCHVEVRYLGKDGRAYTARRIWFCSWSPCVNCSIRLVQFLRQTPNLRLRIFVSRLYFCDMEDSREREGLRMLKDAGVQISVMSYKDFFYCWQTFVARKQSNFKAWDELHQNSVRLTRKLHRILQPCEIEDLRDAFKLLGL